MNRSHQLLSVLALALSSTFISACRGGAAKNESVSLAPNTLSRQELDQGWKVLFDGKSTEGWRVYMTDGMSDGWQVVDGALTLVGSGGDIITDEEFQNYELKIEWQIEEGGNSGIMYNVVEGPGAVYMTGPEMQVLDNEGHHDGGNPLTSAGACYGLYAPEEDVTREPGEWNQARLVVDRGHVEHWLNGTKLCEYDLWSSDWDANVEGSKFKQWTLFGDAKKGHIALQDHGDRVAYRNIKVRQL